MYGKKDLYGGGTNLVATLQGDGMEQRICLSDYEWSPDDDVPGQIRFTFDQPERVGKADVRFYLNDGFTAPEDLAEEKVDLHFPGAESVSVPVADGGEGSVDAFITAVGGTKVMVPVKGPYFEDIESYYGLIDNGNTAVIEMAAAAGLPMVEDRKNPKKTTTYGVGQLILAAAESGVKKIIGRFLHQ